MVGVRIHICILVNVLSVANIDFFINLCSVKTITFIYSFYLLKRICFVLMKFVTNNCNVVEKVGVAYTHFHFLF